MKRNILLDIDGVIANFYKGFGQWLNETYDADIDVEAESPVYSFEEWSPKMEFIDAKKASYDWMLDSGHLDIPIYPGARDFVKELMNLGNVHIVTARVGAWEQKLDVNLSNQVKSDTYEWFKKHGLSTNGPIRFEHNKVELCKEEGISILIEDKLSTALKAAQAGIHAILINRAWNQHPERHMVYRTYNYDQVLDLIRKLSQ